MWTSVQKFKEVIGDFWFNTQHLTLMHLHSIQMLRGTLFISMRCWEAWQNVGIWWPGNVNGCDLKRFFLWCWTVQSCNKFGLAVGGHKYFQSSNDRVRFSVRILVLEFTVLPTRNNLLILITITTFVFVFCSHKLQAVFLLLLLVLILLILHLFHSSPLLMDHGPLGPSSSPGCCCLIYWWIWIIIPWRSGVWLDNCSLFYQSLIFL